MYNYINATVTESTWSKLSELLGVDIDTAEALAEEVTPSMMQTINRIAHDAFLNVISSCDVYQETIMNLACLGRK